MATLGYSQRGRARSAAGPPHERPDGSRQERDRRRHRGVVAAARSEESTSLAESPAGLGDYLWRRDHARQPLAGCQAYPRGRWPCPSPLLASCPQSESSASYSDSGRSAPMTTGACTLLTASSALEQQPMPGDGRRNCRAGRGPRPDVTPADGDEGITLLFGRPGLEALRGAHITSASRCRCLPGPGRRARHRFPRDGPRGNRRRASCQLGTGP